MYDALVANVCFMIHRYLWFETEVTARRDAPPIESAMHRGIFLPLMELIKQRVQQLVHDRAQNIHKCVSLQRLALVDK